MVAIPPTPAQAAAERPFTVAITGASGALGQALLRRWHGRGARLLALTHGPAPLVVHDAGGTPLPLEQQQWQPGAEEALAPLLMEVDLLVLNHGLNPHADRSATATAQALEVNVLSVWRLLELFARLQAERPSDAGRRPEVWVNTSEAELIPTFSPLYELSKRLLGQILSLRLLDLAPTLRVRRLVLGPFRSALNPIGVMEANWVAGEILRQADWNLGLIIVTPNPLTLLLLPLQTLARHVYLRLCTRPAAGSGV